MGCNFIFLVIRPAKQKQRCLCVVSCDCYILYIKVYRIVHLVGCIIFPGNKFEHSRGQQMKSSHFWFWQSDCISFSSFKPLMLTLPWSTNTFVEKQSYGTGASHKPLALNWLFIYVYRYTSTFFLFWKKICALWMPMLYKVLFVKIISCYR